MRHSTAVALVLAVASTAVPASVRELAEIQVVPLSLPGRDPAE